MNRITAAALILTSVVLGQAVRAEVAERGGGEMRLLLGGDISALAEIEKHGGVFRSGGEAGDAIRIMTDHGCNCFRLRLFVEPTGRNVVTNDLPYTIALARRIKAAGAKLLLNFHYSDTWADPGHQSKPKAWEDLDFDALERRVYDYTRDCIAQFRAAGVLPEMVQPGNEITPGILWPDGKLYGVGDPNEQWDKFARLLKAGVRGVRVAAGDDAIRIVLHIHCGGDFAKTKWFFENVERRDVAYDIVGLSYYPWWHGTMEDLRENLWKTATLLNKDVFVVETAYPHRAVDVAKGKEEVARRMRWPQTPQGQEAFLRELIQIVRRTPNGRGLGVLWWYPESILVDGLHIWYGGAMALFDNQGQVLPAMKAFEK